MTSQQPGRVDVACKYQTAPPKHIICHWAGGLDKPTISMYICKRLTNPEVTGDPRGGCHPGLTCTRDAVNNE